MQEEIWKTVVGYESYYEVSNLGNIKSLPREVLKNGKYPFICKEKLLKPGLCASGYYAVILTKNNKKHNISVHKLVAMAFLNHSPDGTTEIVVDHINNIRTDNRVKNLQLISHRENISKDLKGISIYTGVNWCKRNNKWASKIQENKKRYHLGYFTDELEAHEAYQSKLKEILINK